MNMAGIGRGGNVSSSGQPDLLKDTTSAAQQLAKTATANKVKAIKIKIKMKGSKGAS